MFTALDINTNETVTVQPIAVYGNDAFDTLLIRRCHHRQWHLDGN